MLRLEPGEHLQETTRITTATGTSKEKLIETYRGLPVFGQSVVVETQNGDLTGQISGHLVEGIADDVPNLEALLDEEDVVMTAVEHWGSTVGGILNGTLSVHLEIYVNGQDSGQDVIPVLAYFVSYLTIDENDGLSGPTFIIDANNGAMLLSYDGLTSKGMMSDRFDRFDLSVIGGNVKSGKNAYGDSLPPLSVFMQDGICYSENEEYIMIDARTGPVDRENNQSLRFQCEQGFNDSVNGAYSPLADGFFYGSLTHELFMEWLGVEPTEPKLVIITHMDTEGAFYWSGAVHFGDGEANYYPFVVLDIVAHEVGHAFTMHNSRLLYHGQFGGMNEAFSDMTGAAAEGYEKWSDWLNGHDATKIMLALRYFEDPTLDGHSKGSMEEYCPGIDKHYSSGIYNRVFFLLSTTPGWNIRMAFQVFAIANQLYWTPFTAFNDGACAVIQAAEDLGFAAEYVRNAFVEVGINPCGHAKEGVHALHDIRALANETLQFVFIVDNVLHELRFEIYNEYYIYANNSYTLTIRTPTDTIFSDLSYKRIIVPNPEPGRYAIKLDFVKPMFALDLYAKTGSHSLMDEFNVQAIDNSSVSDGTFYLPSDIVDAGLPVLIRSVCEGDCPLKFRITYEGEVDIATNTGEFYSRERFGLENVFTETYICKPKAGSYNYQVEAPYWLMNVRLVAETVMFPDLTAAN